MHVLTDQRVNGSSTCFYRCVWPTWSCRGSRHWKWPSLHEARLPGRAGWNRGWCVHPATQGEDSARLYDRGLRPARPAQSTSSLLLSDCCHSGKIPEEQKITLSGRRGLLERWKWFFYQDLSEMHVCFGSRLRTDRARAGSDQVSLSVLSVLSWKWTLTSPGQTDTIFFTQRKKDRLYVRRFPRRPKNFHKVYKASPIATGY